MLVLMTLVMEKDDLPNFDRVAKFALHNAAVRYYYVASEITAADLADPEKIQAKHGRAMANAMSKVEL